MVYIKLAARIDMNTRDVARTIYALLYATHRKHLSIRAFKRLANVVLRDLGNKEETARYSCAARAAPTGTTTKREHVIPVEVITSYMLSDDFKPSRAVKVAIRAENTSFDKSKSQTKRLSANALAKRIADDAILHAELELNDLIWIAVVTEQENRDLERDINGMSLRQRMPKKPWTPDGLIYERYHARGIQMEEIPPATIQKAQLLK